jgi:type IV secretory pathway VirB2 component (pilin)
VMSATHAGSVALRGSVVSVVSSVRGKYAGSVALRGCVVTGEQLNGSQ